MYQQREKRQSPVIIHAADTHLDFKTKQIQRQNEDGRNVREYDFFQAFERLVQKTLSLPQKPVALVIAGDLFSTPRPTNSVVKGTVSLFNQLDAKGINTIVIAGNHDTPQMRTTTSAFETLMEIEYNNIYFAYDEIKKVILEDVEFIMLPHISLTSTLDPLTLAPNKEDARYSVLVAHGVAAGSDIFRQLDEQREVPISDLFLTLGHDYVALGHHHRQMRVMPGVWYSGSTENTAFGKDASPYRGALIVDLEKMSAEPNTYKPVLMDVNARPLIEPPVIDAEGLSPSAIINSIQKSLSLYSLKDALVRVVVKNIKKETRQEINQAAISELAKDAFYFKIDWRISQVPTFVGQKESHIKPLDQEYMDAVAFYYESQKGSKSLPSKELVTEKGLVFLLEAMELEEDD